MQLYRFTWTVAEHGRLPENGERFLEGFTDAHPEVGPVVSQNTATGHLSITFSLEADDFNAAVEQAIRVFEDGAAASQLEPTEILDLAASLATDHETHEARELQPV
jgi:hypothetical protein